MSIAEKLITVAENDQIITEAVATEADLISEIQSMVDNLPEASGSGENMLLYATGLSSFFSEAVLTDGTEIEIYCPNFIKQAEHITSSAKGLRKLVLRCDDTSGGVHFGQAFNGSSVEILDISNFKHTPTVVVNCFLNSKITTIIGAFDCSLLTVTTNFFTSATRLVDVAFVPNTIKVGINFSSCAHLSDTSIQSIVDGLADLTGQTAQTLTLHATVGAKLTEAQKSAIAAKNWTVTY